jgi:hypothetical protein
MNSKYPTPGSSGSSSTRSSNPPASQDVRAKAGEAASKVTDAARQATDQAKQASSLASDATKQAKGFLNMQVTAGADMVDHVADSARAAAETLDQNAPQLAGLMRNAADRVEEFSEGLRDQTVTTSSGRHRISPASSPRSCSASPRLPASSHSACSRAARRDRHGSRSGSTLRGPGASRPGRDSSMAPELRNSGLIQALTDLFGDFAHLLRKELQLARTEVTEKLIHGCAPVCK